MKEKIKQVLVICLMIISTIPSKIMAHQPVMDMAPRWKNGYGFQTRLETMRKTTLFQGKSEVANPLSLQSDRSIVWLEGIYTVTREHRVSLKLPYVSQTIRSDTGGQVKDTTESGFGDLILGFLNKWYFNQPGLTGNLSLTPSLRLPTGKQTANLDWSHGVIDYGVSISGSIEAYKFYGLLDIFTWLHARQGNGRVPGMRYGFDLDLGYHPYHNMTENSGLFVIMGINGRYGATDNQNGASNSNSGGTTLELVPTLVIYKGNIMARAQIHRPIYTNLNGTQLAPTDGFQLGVGIVY